MKITWSEEQKNNLQRYYDAEINKHYLLVFKNQWDNEWMCTIDNYPIGDRAENDKHRADGHFTMLSSNDPKALMRACEYCIRHHVTEANILRRFDMGTCEWLKSLLLEDEALATFTVSGECTPGYCIIPDDMDLMYVDIHECLENTLERILEAEVESDGFDPVFVSYSIEQLIRTILLADQEEAADEDESEDEVVWIDRGYRIHGALLSFTRVPLTARSFQEKLYERFKLLWMIDHDVTVQDAFTEWKDYLADSSAGNTHELFTSWENDCGFSGALYPCFDEFLETKYRQCDDRWFTDGDEKDIWELDQKDD